MSGFLLAVDGGTLNIVETCKGVTFKVILFFDGKTSTSIIWFVRVRFHFILAYILESVETKIYYYYKQTGHFFLEQKKLGQKSKLSALMGVER